jgi:deoxycytidylate deaminase
VKFKWPLLKKKVVDIPVDIPPPVNTKWDYRFLALAEHISLWSKDPSTRVGAIIIRPNKSIASWPLLPCSICTGSIIQSGIKTVVSCKLNEKLKSRWESSLAITKTMFDETGIKYKEI